MAFQKHPLQKPFYETCNPVSIKPNDYKRGNIINIYYKLQDKKGTARNSLVVFQAVKQKSRWLSEHYKLAQTFEL